MTLDEQLELSGYHLTSAAAALSLRAQIEAIQAGYVDESGCVNGDSINEADKAAIAELHASMSYLQHEYITSGCYVHNIFDGFDYGDTIAN